MTRTNRASVSSNLAFCSLALLGVAALTGCSSTGGADLAGIKADPVPELKTTSETNWEAEIHYAMNCEQNERMFWADLGRVWMTHRPSRLSPFPIQSTGGQP